MSNDNLKSSQEEQQDIMVETVNPTSSIQSQNTSSSSKSMKLMFFVIALAIIGYSGVKVWQSFKNDGSGKPASTTASNASGNTGNDVFGDLDNLRARNEPKPDVETYEPITEAASIEVPPVIKGAPAIIFSIQSSQEPNNNDSQNPATQENLNNNVLWDTQNTGAWVENTDGNNKKTINEYSALPYGQAKAVFSTLNPSLSITKGTFIRCSLRTKIISTVGGEVTCTIMNDVYSTDGRVVLIEKGSQVFGHFKNGGELNLSDARMFVIWNEIRTPRNITIQINSNATGSLGETGIGGWVDNHFWDRFGSAIMVSMITDVSSAVASQASKSDSSSFNVNNTQTAAAETVSSILKETANIPPTLYKNQGDIVGIMFSRDLDFSTVYSLRAK